MAEGPIRIMLVVNEFPPQKFAGTAMATQGLAEALAARGYEVCVVVTTTHVDAVEGEIKPHLTVKWLRDRPFKGIGIPWRLFLLLRVAREWKPDLLQGQAVSCGLLVSLVGRLLHLPTITYAQGMDVLSATPLQKKTEIAWACHGSTRVLAVTRDLAARLADVIGRRGIEVLGHGFVPRESRLPREAVRRQMECLSDIPVVLHVGRMDEHDKDKGQDILLDAWARVLQSLPDARLWLIGDGSWRSALQQQAVQLGIENGVSFMGFRSPAEVADFMNAADMFVLPSRYEPYGLVLLEAMFHRLPIVATDVGGVPEVVVPEGDVWLCSPENPTEMAMAILGGLQQHRYPSAANHEWALKFAWPQHVERFEAIYRAVGLEAITDAQGSGER